MISLTIYLYALVTAQTPLTAILLLNDWG